MTSERDIERLLDRWFADRPTEVSERVLDGVADRIGRQPQHPAWRVFRRDAHVNTYLKPLLAIAAIVVVVVAGFAVLRPSGPDVGGLPVDASPTASPTPAAVPLPYGLLENRDYVAHAVTGDPMAFTITGPEGWTGFGGFFIAGPGTSAAPDGIGISFNHDPEVVTDPCDSSAHTAAPGAEGPSVESLVAALTAREDLQVSGLTDTTLAGYSGKRLDLQLPAEQPCSWYVFAEPKGLYANGLSNRWRVWLLDVDGETAVVVLLDYAATPAEDRATAQAAIDSIRITP